MFNYHINFYILITQAITSLLNEPKNLSLVKAFHKPLQTLNLSFVNWTDNVLYRLQMDSQTIYLERLLNDQFNSGMVSYSFNNSDHTYHHVNGAIYITDADQMPITWWWNAAEGRPPMYLYNAAESAAPVYLYNQAEYDAQDDFTVNIPTAVGSVADAVFVAKVKAWIERYKLAGKRYNLVNY